MGVRILKGGMLTTVQDLGRTGYQSQGFSVSGVMDVRSFKIANLLLDNPENEAVLEFTLMGPTLEFTSETIISITGGDFRPQINGKPAKMYTAIYMHRGDILTFGGARTGTRGYIAFSSYLDIPVVMGSRSTNIKCKIGGFKGRKLEDEDYIGFRAKRRYLPYYLSRSLDLNEFDQEKVTLRVVMGPQEKMFTKEGRETFLNSEYTVTSEFDRMGCRLEGPFIAYKTTSDIISDGIAFGPECKGHWVGAKPWKTDHLISRSTDNRWICKDRNGHLCGYSETCPEKDRTKSKISGRISRRSSEAVSR